MKASKQAKKKVLKLLKNSFKSERDFLDEIVNEQVSRKHVTKALKRLLQKGRILQKDGYYSLKSENEEAKCTEIDHVKQEATEVMIPIAQLLRKRHEEERDNTSESLKINNAISEKEVDIDDEIKRLEAELATNDDKSDESDDDDDTSDDERIPPLPVCCLPTSRKHLLKGIDEQPQQNLSKKSKVSTGLRDAVSEVLSGYVARSSERLPFYCRVCVKQYRDQHDFFEHKESDFHQVAVEVERKKSFCKLCRKQFTSPVQLKEHISSRPHKDRLDQMRARQQGRSKRHDSFVQGRLQNGDKGQSRRQWC
jgi:hypothetical protein